MRSAATPWSMAKGRWPASAMPCAGQHPDAAAGGVLHDLLQQPGLAAAGVRLQQVRPSDATRRGRRPTATSSASSASRPTNAASVRPRRRSARPMTNVGSAMPLSSARAERRGRRSAPRRTGSARRDPCAAAGGRAPRPLGGRVGQRHAAAAAPRSGGPAAAHPRRPPRTEDGRRGTRTARRRARTGPTGSSGPPGSRPAASGAR